MKEPKTQYPWEGVMIEAFHSSTLQLLKLHKPMMKVNPFMPGDASMNAHSITGFGTDMKVVYFNASFFAQKSHVHLILHRLVVLNYHICPNNTRH